MTGEDGSKRQLCDNVLYILKSRVTVKLHQIPYSQIRISLREMSSHGRYNDGNCLPRQGACSLVWCTDVSEKPATAIIIRKDTVCSSEVSVHVYHTARRHVPENGYLHISLLLLAEGTCSSHVKSFGLLTSGLGDHVQQSFPKPRSHAQNTRHILRDPLLSYDNPLLYTEQNFVALD